jgi:hypothetical protein
MVDKKMLLATDRKRRVCFGRADLHELHILALAGSSVVADSSRHPRCPLSSARLELFLYVDCGPASHEHYLIILPST